MKEKIAELQQRIIDEPWDEESLLEQIKEIKGICLYPTCDNNAIPGSLNPSFCDKHQPTYLTAIKKKTSWKKGMLRLREKAPIYIPSKNLPEVSPKDIQETLF